MIETAMETAELLQTYGGWGMVVLVAGALGYLYRDFKKTIQGKDETIAEMNATHHSEIVAVVRECTALLTSVGEALDRVERRME